ncbi:Short-chain dehydrogenase [Pyrenophora tritici-repentis]|uniref:Short-chain dehydrogenase n=2 Tax=Pyrenophora tritici-repentis TaxID=45151 RepID=A0A2W1FP99_9PLEO|nr:retinol dehydrogenase 12 [Pyrenophora tritici-repentis Pt-1C-BFP]KAI0572831.1 Short-chain dehydrogenase [Pyrenophora tritici-repentis]EDU44469.1 retinol dehydrogenase 12 [Pyrenophora tritici-repentis Pt-1C-BFP]KAI0606713.1 Short-chain dehydrogenase [Pyrenophora tritici-repentis]KAI0623679.1 Short-chain dehydrogenase [Pyrenophora tritici-repentis]KAI1519749.1 Short-chain dehydrogenase [Pyrenophora tritici-repentis]
MGFLYSQFFKTPLYPTSDFSGKTVIITGSNVGLGKEAARHYARLDASVLILAVRSLDKGLVAKQEITRTTGHKNIKVWKLDMSDYTSIQSFVKRAEDELDRVDVFIANAGVVRSQYHEVNGHEEGIAVNVIATTLLMRSAPDGQILTTLSHRETCEKYWSQQYPVSKLIQLLIVRAIANRHPANVFPVTVNIVNPGLCWSELAREATGWGFWLFRLVVARSAEVSGRTLVHAGAEGIETHEKYLSDCVVDEPSALVTDAAGKEVQARIMAEVIDAIEVIQPGVSKNFSAV